MGVRRGAHRRMYGDISDRSSRREQLWKEPQGYERQIGRDLAAYIPVLRARSGLCAGVRPFCPTPSDVDMK